MAAERRLYILLLLTLLWGGPPSLRASEDCKASGQNASGLPAEASTSVSSTPLSDQLGPIVINEDGSMRRITNWHEKTERWVHVLITTPGLLLTCTC